MVSDLISREAAIAELESWGDIYGNNAAATIRSLPAAPASAGVTVKPLVWGFNLNGLIAADDYEIHTVGSMGTGGYSDLYFKVMRLGRVIVGTFKSVDAAKAAAQADYTASILAALEPASGNAEGGA